ncbi:MAG: hypothetical protein R2762_12120 [Bryobacteraceae bacterium]
MKLGLLDQVKGDLRKTFADLKGQAQKALHQKDLPHIVFLHGIMGSHLGRPGTRRYWFDVERVIKSNFAEELGLGDDGQSPAPGRKPVQAMGQLEVIYQLAQLRWVLAGFRVHPFAFDWRKSVHLLADELHLFLESIRADAPRVALVAHSMGGLVACEYANRHADWAERVERTVFLGTPLQGSFAPMEALTGDFRIVRLLAAMAVGSPDAAVRLRRMASTMPGLLDMLPAPDVFASASALYTQAVWPDGIVPAQRWLDQSKALKSRIVGSPVLSRAAMLATRQLPTPVAAKVNGKPVASDYGTGDGIVPLKSAVPAGLQAYEVNFPHTALPLDPKAIAAVPKLIRAESLDLRPVAHTEGDEKLPYAETLRAVQKEVEAIRDRAREGKLLDLDSLWLLTGGHR